MVSRDACAPVKCAGGVAILTIEWLDGDRCHARTLYRIMRAASEAGWSHAVQHRFVIRTRSAFSDRLGDRRLSSSPQRIARSETRTERRSLGDAWAIC